MEEQRLTSYIEPQPNGNSYESTKEPQCYVAIYHDRKIYREHDWAEWGSRYARCTRCGVIRTEATINEIVYGR